MSLPEPLREKVQRETAARQLQAQITNLKSALAVDHVADLIKKLVEDGDSARSRLVLVDQKYAEALDVPTDQTLAKAYCDLIKLVQHYIPEWDAVRSEAHTILHNLNSSATGSQPNTKKPDRPTLDQGMSETDWLFFIDEWKRYKTQANLSSSSHILPELRNCCSMELRLALFNFVGSENLANIGEVQLLDHIRKCAVRGKSIAVHRHEFHGLVQPAGQPLHDYVTKLRSKAEQCQFVVTCPNDTCQTKVTFATEMVSDQMLVGCADTDIQGEILAKASTLSSFDDRYEAMQALELGKQARDDLSRQPSHHAVAAKKTAYRKAKETPPTEMSDSNFDSSKCFGCGNHLHGKNLSEHRLNKRSVCPAKDTTCDNCQRKGHFSNLCKSRGRPGASSAVQNPASFVFAVENRHEICPQPTGTVIPHMEWSDGGFRPSNPDPQPTITLQVEVLDCCHEEFGRTIPRIRSHSKARAPVNISVVADTGAQTCTAGPDIIDKLRVPKGYLLDTTHSSIGIDSKSLSYLGCVFLSLSTDTHNTCQAVYVTTGVRGLYLSKRAQIDLGIIPENFPANSTSISASSTENANNTTQSQLAECGCPKRSKPPPKPTHIPFPATEENRERLEEWLRQRYADSAFNTCEHQPLPLMSGRPLDVHFIDGYSPKAYHTPIPVPHHWQRPVKDGIDRDVRIGTLEQVPSGTAVDWCARMVVVSKHDNSPRRAVDLQALNAATKRETHHTPAPYQQVSVIPPGKKKTVCDAWNGYHSLGLAASARDATTFITPWGRYRYLRAPQGFHAAGDGYTKRFDDFTVDVQRKAKCVDDTLLWDDDIAGSFWHTIDYLDLCSANGIVFNPTKFHFAHDEVDFAGFTVTSTGIQPSKSMLEAILNFPTPTDVSGVRSWFGLVNQVAYATAISSQMEPFRDLLKPKSTWYWDEQLDKVFEESKAVIIKQIEHGVQAFELERPTCLATDWSKTGLGYFLLQKHCNCSMTDAPNCCQGGWKLVLAGSRFTSEAESRYAPIEGEALAIVEALEKCRVFVLGCPDLLIATDHKPLLKVLSDRALEDIKNPRLLRLKEKTLMYTYKITHVPGGWHHGLDALSRYPSQASSAAVHTIPIEEAITAHAVAALLSDTDSGPHAVTWDRIRDTSCTDAPTIELIETITNGFPASKCQLPASVQPYWNIRDTMSSIDGVAMVGQRVVVPAPLRGQVLDHLHAAHQGVSSMRSRANLSVYWPTIRNAIQQRRDQCRTCNRIAPSNPAEPLSPSPEPAYPFQLVCADFFNLAGHGYLVYVDRYTAWINIVQMSGDQAAPALIRNLRTLFTQFGIPEELSSDGGPPFPSREVQDFLTRWGVKFRLSSAHYPQSNGRAELAVKTAKRIITDNTGPKGQLNTDQVMAALLQHRNTPMQEIGVSPAQLLYGRNLRDTLPFHEQAVNIRSEWKEVALDREKALAKRNVRTTERYNAHTRHLASLSVGDQVLVQNQYGNNPKRWEKTGTVVETNDHKQYSVKLHGSGRFTLRNRRYLKKIIPMLADAPLPTLSSLVPHTRDEPTVDLPTTTSTPRAVLRPNPPLHLERVDHEHGLMPPIEPLLDPVPNQPLPCTPARIMDIPHMDIPIEPVRRSTRFRKKPRDLSPTFRGASHQFTERK